MYRSYRSQTISILGCGWLGWPLARHLVELGLSVQGSTTTDSKLPLLQKDHIQPYLISCSPKVQGDSLEQFFKADYIFIDVPFKRNLNDPRYFYDQMKSVFDWVERSRVPHVIFSSSTSVYPTKNQIALESDVLEGAEPRAQVLLDSEQMFLSSKKFKGMVIRWAGLFGPGRHPGGFLRDRQEPLSGSTPLNLIHLEDCVSIVEQALKDKFPTGIYNACCPEHPLRSEFYREAARLLGKPMPPLVDKKEPHKVVSCDKLISSLDYQFKFPNPLKGLEYCS